MNSGLISLPKSLLIAGAGLIFSLLALSGSASTGSSSSGNPGLLELQRSVSKDFPGWSRDHSYFIDYAGEWIRSGSKGFYKVYGHWPASWQEVVATGLFQADLYAISGGKIDPDDKKFDFVGDIYYFPPNEFGEHGFIARIDMLNGASVRYIKLVEPTPYSVLFQQVLDHATFPPELKADEYYHDLLRDKQRLLQYATAEMIYAGVGIYKSVYGDYPKSFNALLESKLGPFTPGSINPLTGQPYKGDGSPNDFLYQYYETTAPNGNSAFLLKPVDANGKVPKFGISY